MFDRWNIISAILIVIFMAFVIWRAPIALGIEDEFDKKNMVKYQNHSEWIMEIRKR